eukprot:TRINITY_DN4665_c0_g1_i13.p1 TRINITY_DN4665_c0_g1~~TRINITY_DN4665_c0_g1_i13.p1  ORF type:complete len:478 (+),score=90.10 TRINITY_DN4665_c0_g1_i13:1484-2917(+)
MSTVQTTKASTHPNSVTSLRARSMSMGSFQPNSMQGQVRTQTEKAPASLIQVRYPIPNLDKGYKKPPSDYAQSIHPHRIKLVVVGPEGCGKSSLIRGLSDLGGSIKEALPQVATSGGIFSPSSSSRGIPVSRFHIPVTAHKSDSSSGGSEAICSVTAWEVHGKEEMETIHSMFVNSRPIYIVMWNALAQYEASLRASTEMYIGYWLDLIERYAAGAGVFLVGSFFDVLESCPPTLGEMVNTPLLDFFHIQEEFSSIKMSGSLLVSNTTLLGIPELRLRIANIAMQRMDSVKAWPSSVIEFERQLSFLGSTLPFPVLDLPSILAVAHECGIPANMDTVYALLKLIEDSGQIILTNIEYQSDRGELAQELARLLCILRVDWFGDIVYHLFDEGCYEGDLVTVDDLREKWRGCNANAIEDFRWLLERLNLLKRVDETNCIVPFRSQKPTISQIDNEPAFVPPKEEPKKSSSGWSAWSFFQ